MPIDKNKRRVFRGTLDPLGTMRSIHTAVIPRETTLEELLAPAYFWPVAGRVNAFDTIEASWEDGSRVALLRVMEKDDRAQTLLLVVDSDREYTPPTPPAGYDFEFVNRDAGWRVIQADRKTALRGGFSSALAAAKWLNADIGAAPAPAPKKPGKPGKPGASTEPEKETEQA